MHPTLWLKIAILVVQLCTELTASWHQFGLPPLLPLIVEVLTELATFWHQFVSPPLLQ
jgi:hypothetical protein